MGGQEGRSKLSQNEPTLIHVAGCAVDIGRKRSKNEDVAVTVDVEPEAGDASRAVSLYAVADGMGGHNAGEVASKMAVDTALQQMVGHWKQDSDLSRESYKKWLQKAVQVANQKIYAINNEDRNGMGTTLVMAMVVDQDAFIVNIGDSRAYQISPEGMSQITTDHSVVQGLIEAGAITPEEAKSHPFRNYLTQAIGTEASVAADLFVTELKSEDRLLLCSDGLTNELDDEAIYGIVQSAKSPQSACETLVEAANESGGHDNISVVLVEIKPGNIHS